MIKRCGAGLNVTELDACETRSGFHDDALVRNPLHSNTSTTRLPMGLVCVKIFKMYAI